MSILKTLRWKISKVKQLGKLPRNSLLRTNVVSYTFRDQLMGTAVLQKNCVMKTKSLWCIRMLI